MLDQYQATDQRENGQDRRDPDPPARARTPQNGGAGLRDAHLGRHFCVPSGAGVSQRQFAGEAQPLGNVGAEVLGLRDFEEKRTKSLGLQLVSDLIKQLNGQIEIGGGPGTGAVFEVTFAPKRQAEAIT